MNNAEALGRVFKAMRGKMSQELIGFNLGFSQRKVSELENKGVYQLTDIEVINYYDRKITLSDVT